MMNCREALSQLAKERDAPLPESARSALAGHLAHCDSCRQAGANLDAALAGWRADANRVVVPDADAEWRIVRRRIREESAAESVPGWHFKPTWLLAPLAAAAAIAVVIYYPRTPLREPHSGPGASIARANSVEVPGGNSSTMVFVDDKSGWLIVWASDAGGG